MSFFEADRLSAADAITRAQHIAFAPMVFQATRTLRTLGILAALDQPQGSTSDAVVERTGVSVYGVRVLLEAGLGIGLVTCRKGVYELTKVGWFMLHDRMTIANLDFSHDVCYEGLAALDESVRRGEPAGLAVFGEWATIYQALVHLPPAARRSWFAFDHFYSDDAFPLVMRIIARYAPASILDIGGNVGKFALQCLRHDPVIRVGIADLSDMSSEAVAALQAQGVSDRVAFHPINVLDPAQALPTGYGAIWMSQFLDCFSDEQVVAILAKVRAVLSDETPVFILEPFWDRQRREVAAFSLQMTSLYFTAMANGNSQMYHSELFLQLVARAGLSVVEQRDNIGVCQSLLVCRRT